ncbi:MAG: tRNA lysidine(34) synthetase TilS [Candidatus Solibacter sp.]
MLDRVVHTIERHGMFAGGDRVAIAVSGGADSVCLLHVLRELGPRWDLTLSVVHINHNLRGDASRGDAEFVRSLAASFDLPFTLHELDLNGARGNLEQAAREARLAFFHDHLAGGLATRIALGHTRSDQAETVLFRFLRGSGATGLAAIRPVTEGGIVRPLIEIERREITGFLGERGMAWREDASNATLDFARNRIRHQLLPQLAREWNPALGETLAHTADLSLAEEAYWEAEMDRLAERHLTRRGPAVFVSAAALAALPLAAARRLVRRAIHMASGGPASSDFGHIAAVVELAGRARGTGRTQVPGLEVRRSFDWLRLAPPTPAEAYCLCPAVPGVTRIPGTDFGISLELLENSETTRLPDNVYNGEMGCLDWNRLSGPLKLRNWRPGDQYQPMGIPTAKKIKTLFQQARIPVWERAQWPVLTDAKSIVWVRRFGIAAAVTAGIGSSRVLAVGELEVR